MTIRERAATTHLTPPAGDISTISNELEWSLQNVSAADIISANPDHLELESEVNQRDVVELLISMASSADQLNSIAHASISQLATLVADNGGQMYGGSAVLADVSTLEPARYRTTCLSEQLAHDLLNVTSHQIIIGVAREGTGDQPGAEFGISLYNLLRQISPLVFAISASSPYRVSPETHSLQDTQTYSQRVNQYRSATRHLPQSIIETPRLANFQEYEDRLRAISREVNYLLATNQLDANLTELYRDREHGAYAPFNDLEPHQVYWMVRLRPDHANADSVYSIELRIGDLPIRAQTISAINSFVLGISYYAAAHGTETLDQLTHQMRHTSSSLLPALDKVAQMGLHTELGGGTASTYLSSLMPFSINGLESRNQNTELMTTEFEQILGQGTDATHIRDHVEQNQITNPIQLISWLEDMLNNTL